MNYVSHYSLCSHIEISPLISEYYPLSRYPLEISFGQKVALLADRVSSHHRQDRHRSVRSLVFGRVLMMVTIFV